MLLVTAKELHAQGDALVPLPRQDADISPIERWLKDVLFVNVVVAVTWKDLDTEQQPIKSTQIIAAVKLKTIRLFLLFFLQQLNTNGNFWRLELRVFSSRLLVFSSCRFYKF